jgi:hypothetical protein
MSNSNSNSINTPNLSSINNYPNPIHVSSNSPLQFSVFNTPQNQNQNLNVNNFQIKSPQFKQQPVNFLVSNGTNYNNLFQYPLNPNN